MIIITIVLKTVKVRLYPTKQQKQYLAKSFGCVRWFWNYSLNSIDETYQATGKGLSRADIQGMLPQLKKQEVICVENLNVKGMVKNHNLAKAISQVGWGMFCTMLKYKAENEGKVYQEVDRFFPSSKTCNVCLNQIKSLSLDIRYWDCSNCGTKHIDRDINAAKNIRDEGLRIISCGTRDKAYCPDVRPSKGGRKKSTITRQSVG